MQPDHPPAAPDQPSPPPELHVVIVEDDPVLLEALSAAVNGAADMLLAGTASSRQAALALLQGPPADVLLVDLGLPDGSGIDVIGVASFRWPSCNIMVSTSFGDDTHVMRSIEAGADGYLLKDSAPERIVTEIRHLAAGGSPISPIIARQVLERFRLPGAGAGAAPQVLSAREKEVLDYITKGFTAQEIARLMQLSPFTVRTFVRRIYAKLKVGSRVEAIAEARARGLLDD